jgi:hypothetical protein
VVGTSDWLNYIPLGLQLAIMDLLSVFDVFGKNTYASMVPFSSFWAQEMSGLCVSKVKKQLVFDLKPTVKAIQSPTSC